ncbi:MAG: hypothetical protein JXP34_00055 [Planctomycetes bacterium]|nr:hypothetical protein [Planctomycetota bacterium]
MTARALAAIILVSTFASTRAAGSAPDPARFAVRIVLGLRDAEPTDWSGCVRAGGATLVRLEPWRLGAVTQRNRKADAEGRILPGGAWSARTSLVPISAVPLARPPGQAAPRTVQAPSPVGVFAFFDGTPRSIEVLTPHGTFSASGDALAYGRRMVRCRAHRLPPFGHPSHRRGARRPRPALAGLVAARMHLPHRARLELGHPGLPPRRRCMAQSRTVDARSGAGHLPRPGGVR